MSVTGTTRFGGVAGRVLWGTLSVQNLIAGIALGGVIFVTNVMLVIAGATLMSTVVNHILLAFLASRFVLSGQHGEWQGSFLSAAAGNWNDVKYVAGRYLALNAVWLLPLLMFALANDTLGSDFGRGAVVLSGLYLVGTFLTPPVMLIAAVSAEGFSDLVKKEFWRKLFTNREQELISVYATYCGGAAMAALIAMPIVLLALAINVELGIFAAAIALCFVVGASLDLLGRLCGFFTLGEINELDVTPLTPVLSPVAHAVISRRKADANLLSPSAHAALVDQPIQDSSTPGDSDGSLPKLGDAKLTVDEIMSRLADDPSAASIELEALSAKYAVSAQVLGARCIAHHRLGEDETAMPLAGEAMVLAFKRGHLHLAADIFRELRGKVSELGLNREQILAVASAAAAKGDLSTAGESYSMVLTRHPEEIRAARGLLDVAERILREKSNPAVAIKVYRFLEEHCAGGQLADAIMRGLTIAERRAAICRETD